MRVRGRRDIRPRLVDARMNGVGRCVDGARAFNDLAIMINQDEVRDADARFENYLNFYCPLFSNLLL